MEAQTQTNETNNAATSAVTAAVAVKLPEFWKNDPRMWFAQAEAQFALAGVVQDETKYYHIISKLDQTVIIQVADIVTEPPKENKYPAVKGRLISRYEVSAQGKLEQLLNSCDLGDMRPSHLLARMLELAAGLNVNESVLRVLFIQRMPERVKTILSICDGNTLQQLANMADKITDFSPSVVAATSSAAVPGLSDLQDQIAQLTAEVRRMKTSDGRSRSSSRSRQSGAPADSVCWYHRKYGRNAQQCREPCVFKDSKN